MYSPTVLHGCCTSVYFLRIYTNKTQLKYNVTVDTPQTVSGVSQQQVCVWFLLVR